MSPFTFNYRLNISAIFTSSKTIVVVLALLLSACSTSVKPPQENNQAIDMQCLQHAMAIEKQAAISTSSAQYLAAANALSSCLDVLSFANNSVQQKKWMQLHAVSTLNFIKGGDLASARQMLAHFKSKFPNQDLYFADYTSYLDTTTALLSSESLTALQLASLNISRKLRVEIERKHYWLAH